MSSTEPKSQPESQLASGLSRYLDCEQISHLGQVKIGIAGIGGLGSNCAMLLARSGVRHFVLADFDRVEPSNLNRQFFWPDDLGKYKVEALAAHLSSLDPGIETSLHPICLSPENIPGIFSGCDVIIEALDDAGNKALFCNIILQNSLFKNSLLIAASGIAGFGGPMMQKKRLGQNFICVGEFSREAGTEYPPLAPRVMQASAMQADAALEYILTIKHFG